MLNFIKWLFYIWWNDHMVFVFLLLMWCITLIDLHMLNHPCNPGWIQLDYGVWSFLCVVGFSFLIFCWIFLDLSLSKILACSFLFIVSLYDFGMRVMVASWNDFGSVPPSLMFWRTLREIIVSSVFGRILQWSHLVLDFCLQSFFFYLLLLHNLFQFQGSVH